MEEENKLVKAKSFYDGKWSSERILKNPIQSNTDFFIQVVATRSEFEIYYGGSYLFSLKHYIPMDSISGIRLLETMELYRVEMEQL
uniref:Galectin n=1 Tax=Caenorhabditis tropicalis TaxID=1561998 RepID=A0A1I7U7K1_9PELO